MVSEATLSIARYPHAYWAPWQNPGAAYYQGLNRPIAEVKHVMQGHARTAVQWAAQGYTGASWHFTIDTDGTVYQHLRLIDGGFQAGISRYRYDGAGRIYAENPPPTWPLWRGWAQNVNHYTIGTENAGFSGTQFTDAQFEANRDLSIWLADTLEYDLDADHIPGHCDISLLDRPNDPQPPWLRAEFNRYLLEGGEMAFSEEDIRRIARDETEKHVGATFRRYLDLAINGGDGGFTDPQGNSLPLVESTALTRRVASLEAATPGLPSGALVRGDRVQLT